MMPNSHTLRQLMFEFKLVTNTPREDPIPIAIRPPSSKEAPFRERRGVERSGANDDGALMAGRSPRQSGDV